MLHGWQCHLDRHSKQGGGADSAVLSALRRMYMTTGTLLRVIAVRGIAQGFCWGCEQNRVREVHSLIPDAFVGF